MDAVEGIAQAALAQPDETTESRDGHWGIHVRSQVGLSALDHILTRDGVANPS